jgi:mRNA interferase RelE/StbE
VYLDQVEQDLRKLDKSVIRKILSRIETYLAKDPKELGKPLTGEFQGYWRYRWGDYRVIYKISEREILILVLRISHRKDVYD